MLIVDDNLSLANLYQIVFERNGWQARFVSSGEEALDSIEANLPDYVLLDILMPEMDGVEVCRRIRSEWPSAPPRIVVYTASTRPELRELCASAGADMFFNKNVSIFELPEKVAGTDK